MTEHEQFKHLLEYLNSKIVGQPELTKRLTIALLSSGHLLVEGAPGLAKTTAIKTLSSCIIAHIIAFNLLQIYYLLI